MRAHTVSRRITGIAALVVLATLAIAPAAQADATWSPLATEAVSDNLSTPALAATPAGTLIAVAAKNTGSSNELTVFRSTDTGANWTAGTVLSSNTGAMPTVAALGNGTLLAAWSDVLPLTEFTSITQLKVSRSTDDGLNWSEPSVFATGPQHPALAAVGASGAVLTWYEFGSPNGSMVAMTTTDGENWSAPHYSDGAFVAYGPVIAVSDTGSIAITWTESEPNDTTPVRAKVVTFNGTYWSDTLTLDSPVEDMVFGQWPSITSTADGNFVIITQGPMMTNRPVLLSVVSPNGELVSSTEFPITNGASSMQVTRTGDGTLVAGWVEPGEFDLDSFTNLSYVTLVRSTDNGLTWSDPSPLLDLTVKANTFALAGGPDGHLLLTFGAKLASMPENLKTVFAALSTDAGLNWNEPVATVDELPNNGFTELDLYLARPIVLPQGGFFLGYSTDTFTGNARYAGWRVVQMDFTSQPDGSSESGAGSPASLAATGSTPATALGVAALAGLAGLVLLAVRRRA